MPVPDLYQVTFIWPHPEHESVIVTGTFDEWSGSTPLTKTATGFEGTASIPWGQKIKYKFIVDGQWFTHEDQPTEIDPGGFVNNVYTAPSKPVDETTVAPTAAVTDTIPVKDEAEPTPNGHTTNGNGAPLGEVAEPATVSAQVPQAESEQTEPGVAEASTTEEDKVVSEASDKPLNASVIDPLSSSEPPSTIDAHGETTSTPDDVASGVGAADNAAVGAEPINIQKISIPIPNADDAFNISEGSQTAPKTAAPQSALSTNTVYYDAESPLSPVAPIVPILIVPVNAAENNTVAPSEQEVVPAPVSEAVVAETAVPEPEVEEAATPVAEEPAATKPVAEEPTVEEAVVPASEPAVPVVEDVVPEVAPETAVAAEEVAKVEEPSAAEVSTPTDSAVESEADVKPATTEGASTIAETQPEVVEEVVPETEAVSEDKAAPSEEVVAPILEESASPVETEAPSAPADVLADVKAEEPISPESAPSTNDVVEETVPEVTAEEPAPQEVPEVKAEESAIPEPAPAPVVEAAPEDKAEDKAEEVTASAPSEPELEPKPVPAQLPVPGLLASAAIQRHLAEVKAGDETVAAAASDNSTPAVEEASEEKKEADPVASIAVTDADKKEVIGPAVIEEPAVPELTPVAEIKPESVPAEPVPAPEAIVTTETKEAAVPAVGETVVPPVDASAAENSTSAPVVEETVVPPAVEEPVAVHAANESAATPVVEEPVAAPAAAVDSTPVVSEVSASEEKPSAVAESKVAEESTPPPVPEASPLVHEAPIAETAPASAKVEEPKIASVPKEDAPAAEVKAEEKSATNNGTPVTPAKVEEPFPSESKDSPPSSNMNSVRKKRTSIFGKIKNLFSSDKEEKKEKK